MWEKRRKEESHEIPSPRHRQAVGRHSGDKSWRSQRTRARASNRSAQGIIITFTSRRPSHRHRSVEPCRARKPGNLVSARTAPVLFPLHALLLVWCGAGRRLPSPSGAGRAAGRTREKTGHWRMLLPCAQLLLILLCSSACFLLGLC